MLTVIPHASKNGLTTKDISPPPPKKSIVPTYRKQDTAHPKINLLRLIFHSQPIDFSLSGEKNTNLRRFIKSCNSDICKIYVS
jgi:hypothetical protein